MYSQSSYNHIILPLDYSAIYPCHFMLTLSNGRSTFMCGHNNLLIGGFKPPEKYEFVCRDPEIPNCGMLRFPTEWNKLPVIFQTTTINVGIAMFMGGIPTIKIRVVYDIAIPTLIIYPCCFIINIPISTTSKHY